MGLMRQAGLQVKEVHYVPIEFERTGNVMRLGPAPRRIVESAFRKRGIHVYLKKGIARVDARPICTQPSMKDRTSHPTSIRAPT